MNHKDQAMVTRRSLLDLQVCVPSTWTDAQVEAFANTADPTGLQNSPWQMKHDGNPTLMGDPERVQCQKLPTHVHIMLEC